MKARILSSVAGLMSLFSFAQTTTQQTENRTIKPFTTLEVNGAARVEIVNYDTLICKVTADPKDQFNILVMSKGDKLIITTTGVISKNHRVLLGCRGLKTIVTDGAAKVESDVIYKTDKMSIQANGASKDKLMIEAKQIEVSEDGSATLRLQGKTDSISVNVNGSSDFRGASMESKKAIVNASGASTAIVHSKQAVNANADGSSKVYYDGNPPDKVINKSGSSTIKEYDPNDKYNYNYNYNYSSNSGNTGTHHGKYQKSYGNETFKRWMGIGINWNGYTTQDASFTMPDTAMYMELNSGKCMSWDIHFIEHDFKIWKNYLQLGTGMGFDFNRFHLKHPVILDPDSSFVTATYTTGNNYRKNILKASYLVVPLFLEINTNKNPYKSFHISAGAEFGLKMGSRTKQVFERDGYKNYIYKKDDYNLNPFRVQGMVSVGYGNFSLFANYSLTPLFQKKQGPDLRSFTIGLRFMYLDFD